MFSRINKSSLNLVRSYATSSSSVAPPIQLHGLSGKYAGAAYSAALKKSAATLKQVETDLIAVKSTLSTDAAAAEFLNNPALNPRAKSAAIDELLKKASGKGTPSEMTKNLFEVLAENGRLYESEKVIADFLEIMAAHRKEVVVTFTTAQPLDKDLRKRLEDSLNQSTIGGEGMTLIFENKINEAILGGLVVDCAGKTVDLSVASRVNALNASLSEPI